MFSSMTNNRATNSNNISTSVSSSLVNKMSIGNAANTSNNTNAQKCDITAVEHPLFHLAIVEKLHSKVPFINQMTGFVEQNYGKLKSTFLAGAIDTMENRICSVAQNVVHLVPKQPVKMVDQMACQGFAIIETKVDTLAQTSKEVQEQMAKVRQTLIGKLNRVKESDPIYRSLDRLLTMFESTLDYLLPLENDNYLPANSTNRPTDEESSSASRFLERLRRFTLHFRLHLINYTKGEKWFGRVVLLLKLEHETNANQESKENCNENKQLEKADSPKVQLGKMICNGESKSPIADSANKNMENHRNYSSLEATDNLNKQTLKSLIQSSDNLSKTTSEEELKTSAEKGQLSKPTRKTTDKDEEQSQKNSEEKKPATPKDNRK